MKKSFFLIILLICSFYSHAQDFSSADTYIMQGAKLHDQKKYTEALSKYQQALKINPNSISALYETALTYLQLEEYPNAIKYSNQVLGFSFEPIKLDAYVIKGTALAKSGKNNEAIALFQEAINELGASALLDYNLGLVYYNLGNNKKAIGHIRRAIEQDPTYPDAFYLYATILNDLGIYIQSIYAYDFFLLQEPNTERSNKAFTEMYKILSDKLTSANISDADKSLGLTSLYSGIDKLRADLFHKNFKYDFFSKSSQLIFDAMSKILKNDPTKYRGLFWDFFVPIYDELLVSTHFETFLRYISVSYFPDSLKWWETNVESVMAFKLWFEDGIDQEMDESTNEEYDDNAIDSDIVEMDQQ